MKARIAILAGDGIGEEVMSEALRVLEHIARAENHEFQFSRALIGGAAYDQFESHFPDVTREACRDSDAILFGSTGGPLSEMHLAKWKNCETNSILALRKTFRFHANFRPVRVYPELARLSPLRPEIIGSGLDILFIRELLGDVYFGEHKTFLRDGRRVATDLAEYTEDQVVAIARVAFRAAKQRRGKLTSVDKANVLDSSKLWRTVVREVSAEYPEVELNDLFVDNCAMQLVLNPAQFDVVLAPNLFGDILSDAGATLPGSLGLMPSASLNEAGFGMYEPAGGSAPDIAGKGIANPIAQILSAALMLRFSFGLEKEAQAIEGAVEKALKSGARTRELAKADERVFSTREMGDAILASF